MDNVKHLCSGLVFSSVGLVLNDILCEVQDLKDWSNSENPDITHLFNYMCDYRDKIENLNKKSQTSDVESNKEIQAIVDSHLTELRNKYNKNKELQNV